MLYVGTGKPAKSLGKKAILTAENLHDISCYSGADRKPILRPLSDMSKEEYGELMKQGVDNPDLGMAMLLLHAVQIKWLLSKHFDLFGLIKAGLATGREIEIDMIDEDEDDDFPSTV